MLLRVNSYYLLYTSRRTGPTSSLERLFASDRFNVILILYTFKRALKTGPAVYLKHQLTTAGCVYSIRKKEK